MKKVFFFPSHHPSPTSHPKIMLKIVSSALPRASTSLFSSLPLPLQRTFHSSPVFSQQSWDDDPVDDDRPRNARRGLRPTKKVGVKTPPGTIGPPPDEKELARRAEGRILRAERLERKDLTAQLTPTKTCACAPPSFVLTDQQLIRSTSFLDMGGFTQPRHLAFLNTLDPTRKPKDSYEIRVGDSRVRPPEEAYEPHCVYLAVTRYPVRWGHGRATRRECFSGFCKESELAERFQEMNYGKWREEHVKKGSKEVEEAAWFCRSEAKEYIDLAVWPGSPEERSILNKAFFNQVKAYQKKRKLEQEDTTSPTPSSPDEADSLPPPDKALFLPAIENWERPLPPHTDFPLIIPLLTLTLPTRPLASTLARLCNSHPRGLPFYASVPNEDRKDGPAFFRRLLRMRSDRIRTLTSEILEKLQGYGGGFFGLRLSAEDKGRGVEGEDLSEVREAPGGKWAEVKLLEEGSDVWDGIEREMFMSDWQELDQGERWTAKATRAGGEIEAKGGVGASDSSEIGGSQLPPPRDLERPPHLEA